MIPNCRINHSPSKTHHSAFDEGLQLLGQLIGRYFAPHVDHHGGLRIHLRLHRCRFSSWIFRVFFFPSPFRDMQHARQKGRTSTTFDRKGLTEQNKQTKNRRSGAIMFVKQAPWSETVFGVILHHLPCLFLGGKEFAARHRPVLIDPINPPKTHNPTSLRMTLISSRVCRSKSW